MTDRQKLAKLLSEKKKYLQKVLNKKSITAKKTEYVPTEKEPDL